MAFWIGVGLIIYGCAHLLFMEPIVRVKRRLKPWWRDADPAQDRSLLLALFFITYVGSVFAVEIGVYLTASNLTSLPVRTLFYGASALWLGWRLRQSSPTAI